MLNYRLKTIERKTLNPEVKSKQIQTILKQQKKRKLNHTFTYSATIVLFVALFFIFIQTINNGVKIEPLQQAPTFELGEIKKASYLFSNRPEKMYDLTSPFYIEKLSTTKPDALIDFREFLDGVEMKPFTRDISEFSDGVNYLFELKNGDNVYLKSFYEDEHMIFIDPTTMMELVVKETNPFSIWWLLASLENKQLPKWKIALFLFFIIAVFLYEKGFRKRMYPNYKNSIWINLSSYFSFVVIAYWTTKWLGTPHLLLLLFAVTTCFIVLELLYALFKLKPFNWKEHMVILSALNVLFSILLL